MAAEKIKEISTRKKLPILVGGSGMYINSLIKGFSYIPDIEPEVRAQVRSFQQSLDSNEFFELLKKTDPVIVNVLNARDSQRVARAYEVFLQTGKSILYYQKSNAKLLEDFVFKIILLLPDRKFLYSMCNNRLEQMFKKGAVEEVKSLLNEKCNINALAMKSLGVKEIISYLENRISKDEAMEIAKTRTRQYAKRQVTWFKNQLQEKDIIEFSNYEEYEKILTMKRFRTKMYSDAVVIIPARIASTRLENKPLQMIGNKTMIEHVVSRVSRIEVAGVFVATDSEEIFSLVTSKGFSAIMTDKNCLTGTDRVYEAFKKFPNSTAIKYVINVQGDMPFIDEAIIPKIIEGLKTGRFDIMTSVVKVGKDIAGSSSNVKVVIDKNNKALYFSRSLVPSGASEFLYHVGIYGFKAPLLEKFVLLEQSENEKSENLEQLRALDNGMTIGVCYSNEIPISVDTKEDLAKARDFIAKNPGYLT
eukprot:jgi/Mesvir1/25250/Mv20317-RA.1